MKPIIALLALLALLSASLWLITTGLAALAFTTLWFYQLALPLGLLVLWLTISPLFETESQLNPQD